MAVRKVREDKARKTARKPNDDKKLLFRRADDTAVDLEGFYQGAAVFMMCGGPSLAELNLKLLGYPGFMVWGMNNSWKLWKPDLWTHMDRPGSFFDFRWTDPSILKFVPDSHKRGFLHTKVVDGGYIKNGAYKGKFKKLNLMTADCPGVLYYKRNRDFQPKSFFTENTVNWGNHGRVQDPLGFSGVRSVMLASLRMCVWLGFKRIYLIGADFNMPSDLGKQYGWGQRKGVGGVNSNNRAYGVLAKRFESLKGELAKREVKVVNCTARTKLLVFPREDFEVAVKRESKGFLRADNGEGWYDHPNPK